MTQVSTYAEFIGLSAAGGALIAGGTEFLAVGAAGETGEIGISFSERVLARMAEAADDPFHNFPTSFAEYILKYGGIGISGTRYIQYEIPGVINGRNGVYQVGGHWIGNVFEITHWFFKPF